MSALARAVNPAPLPQSEPRHIEVVPTRAQRKARPKVFYAMITVGGLFAVLIAQLLLSIVVSDGAYEIAALQQQQRELARDEQQLTEALHVLESPQHLAANAVALGMVTSTGTAYLRLADGAVLGAAVQAKPTDGIVTGEDGQTLIPNVLLGGVPLVTPAAGEPTTGAPDGGSTDGSIASTEALPAPTTR
jgi:hypothetical protein